MWIGYRKDIRELMFRALALRRSKRIRSTEGLTLETPAPESLYGGQFTLSTQFIEPNCSLSVDPLILLNFRSRQLILIALDVGVAGAAFRAYHINYLVYNPKCYFYIRQAAVQFLGDNTERFTKSNTQNSKKGYRNRIVIIMVIIIFFFIFIFIFIVIVIVIVTLITIIDIDQIPFFLPVYVQVQKLYKNKEASI